MPVQFAHLRFGVSAYEKGEHELAQNQTNPIAARYSGIPVLDTRNNFSRVNFLNSTIFNPHFSLPFNAYICRIAVPLPLRTLPNIIVCVNFATRQEEHPPSRESARMDTWLETCASICVHGIGTMNQSSRNTYYYYYGCGSLCLLASFS